MLAQITTKISSAAREVSAVQHKIQMLEQTMASAKNDWNNNVEGIQKTCNNLTQYKIFLEMEIDAQKATLDIQESNLRILNSIEKKIEHLENSVASA